MQTRLSLRDKRLVKDHGGHLANQSCSEFSVAFVNMHSGSYTEKCKNANKSNAPASYYSTCLKHNRNKSKNSNSDDELGEQISLSVRPAATGVFVCNAPQFFVSPSKFCCAKKNLFQAYNVNDNHASRKMFFKP